MKDEIGNEIVQKLEILIKLIASSSLGEDKSKDRVRFLAGIGLQPKEIAEILGTTSNSVRATLSKLRKEAKNR